ncbi:synaptogenesis protein syg-2-like isoform X3 [Diachasmimorpha longicaudata]|uniref:synaptogenesis protein syg-2-like isoform X3 n=1 Tax=Diachasmimorpha longicaudata TaxID=58733 RepID=UPI0030B8D031
MRYPSTAVTILIVFFASVRAQGIPRTFLARPFRGGPPVQVRAVVDGVAELPCDIRPPQPNDSAVLVVWYKASERLPDLIPIYSYDTRSKHPDKAAHWKDKEYLNERGHFKTATEPAILNIRRVEQRDEGEYLCRVDFVKSPTRNSKIYLTIIVPPHKPNIIDEHGKTVSTVAGPYEEGGSMRLTCLVSGGRPAPTVRWWRGETLLESKDEPGEFPALRRNTLIVTELTRADLHAAFTCQASNNNISQPVSASVIIEMHLRPLTVEILSSEHAPLSADRKYDINCRTMGSRPSAKLSWFMEGKMLKNSTQRFSEDGNMTMSTLTFTPTREDHDKLITCRAENSNVDGGFEEDTWKLNIFFVPILKLELGSKMNPDDIEEGDDVYFECKVRANPEAYKVVWKHNGMVIHNNAKKGVIVQQYSLALRQVDRFQAGNYMCVASNVEGDGYSGTVELKIMYKPICIPDQKRIYGVGRLEEAKVVCRVEAYPPPSNFRWAFNNTEEMADVPQARYKNSTRHTQSVLTYKPVTEMDYGTVLCWASNTAGQQANACIFHIIPAGKPEAPYNCTLTNQTTESLSIECSAGFDGGQPQNFLLEVYDQYTGILQANVTSRDNAAFTVQDLEPGKVLTMKMYAYNSRGRSESTKLEGFTLKVAEKQTVCILFTGSPVPFEITPLLGVLIGIVAALLLITVIILGALKIRSDRRAHRPGDLPLKKATAPSSEDLYDADDRNPDVVPTNKDSDYQLTGSTAGTPLAVQVTPDQVSTTSLPNQQTNHLQGLSAYAHNEYNNYPTLPLTGEVTYAELCLARPTTLSTTADTKLACLSGVGGLGGFNNANNNGGGGGSGGGGGGGGGVLVGGKPYIKEATVYACIDHNARVPKIDQICQSTKASTVGLLQDTGVISTKQHHPREVVTVRTPLISTQESCV